MPPLPLSTATDSENSLKILCFCPSEYWGSTERIALNDCVELDRAGFDVALYVLKDSFLDLKAKQFNLKTFPHHGPISTSVLRWNRLNQFRELIEHEKFNVVHCYDYHYLWQSLTL